LKIFYTDHFPVALPKGHRFPIEKYALLRESIIRAGLVRPGALRVPHPATDEEIIRAHDPDYLRRVVQGELTAKEVRRIGLPLSKQLVERARRSCGATIEACGVALKEGVAVQLAGGTHHAFRDRGEGYCVFNDSAIAARALQSQGLLRKVVVIDCDVHQGNGTASIFKGDPTVFTFSIHGRNNFPYHKEESDLDIELDDGIDDAPYLEALEKGLQRSLGRFRADLAIYLAGADPFSGDRFGRLGLSKEGLACRDRMVLEFCRRFAIPVAVTMAGGYGKNLEDTVDIHLQTVRLAMNAFGKTDLVPEDDLRVPRKRR
jgi:acetoin utilization deacetylase AcuC-like enzyme